MKEKDDLQALTVAVRIRPFSNAEIGLGCTDIAHSMDEKMVVLMDPCDDQDDILRANRSREKQYVFDESFGPRSTQKDVYEKTTKVLIQSVMDGFNATVFAYGPTGAGKTYTMLGTDKEPGIMVRTLNDLYKEMENTREDSRYEVTMSYLEIYNEMIRDLLNPSVGFLELREDSKGVQVAGLSEVEAKTTREIMQMLVMGNKQRTCEPTAVNKTSSRSHAVLQVTVKQRSRVRNVVEQYRIGKLFMIDLAGSERASQTQNRGKRLIEGAHINRSLLALGNCINALCEKGAKGSQYINYRDSKLTRLLKDSLGGNCKTVMIAHISPASMCFEESRNTLNYADRAKNIKLKIKKNQYSVNYHIAQYQSIIAELRQEILRLKTKMAEKSLQVREVSTSAKACKESKQLNDIREQLVSDFQTQMETRREQVELEHEAMQMSVEYQRNVFLIDEWEQEKVKRAARLRLKYAKRLKRQDEDSSEGMRLNPFDATSHKANEPEDTWEPSDVAAAREKLLELSNRERQLLQKKSDLTGSLDDLKSRRNRVEDSLPNKISCEEHMEVLKLLCQVHELELKNAELESVTMLRDHLTQQKDVTLQKQEMKQKLCDEIIQCQRILMEEKEIDLPIELATLYQMYLVQMGDSDMTTYPGTPKRSISNTQRRIEAANVKGAASSLLGVNAELLSTVGESSIEDESPLLCKRVRKKWADSLSDMESEEGLVRDADTGFYKAKTMPFSFAQRETASTIHIANASETDDTNKGTKQKPRKKNKTKRKRKDKKTATASVSRKSQRVIGGDGDRPSVSLDPSLQHLLGEQHVESMRMAHSVNDLPAGYHSDRPSLDARSEEEGSRPTVRQRSSSLDMGREKLRLRKAMAAETKAQKSKQSNIQTPSELKFENSPYRKPKYHQRTSQTQGDYTTFQRMASPTSTVYQHGTMKPGHGHKLQRHQRIPGIDKPPTLRARVGNHNGSQTNSTIGHQASNHLELRAIGGKKATTPGVLSVSGTAVMPKKARPGIKRY